MRSFQISWQRSPRPFVVLLDDLVEVVSVLEVKKENQVYQVGNLLEEQRLSLFIDARLIFFHRFASLTKLIKLPPLDQLEELTSGLRGPPGPPGRSRPGKRGRPGLDGEPGESLG